MSRIETDQTKNALEERAVTVADLQSGNSQSWDRLYQQQHTRMMKVARGFTRGDDAAAEDIVQDVWVKFFDRVSSGDLADGNLGGYLSNSVRTTGIDRWRRGQRIAFEPLEGKPSEDSDAREFAAPDDPAEEVVERIRGTELLADLGRSGMYKGQLATLVFRAEDFGYEEIAEITEQKLGTVRSSLSRAREIAAKIVSPQVDRASISGRKLTKKGNS